MLQELHIRNYAIIEEAELHFNPNLNVIIGETGAGKSILMGALNLVLGNRADTQVLMNKKQKCIVEAHLNIENYELESFFEEEDLDYSEETIIRREIAPNGKSRAFINDVPVTLSVLKTLTSRLIDIHEQDENSQLSDPDFLLFLLDKISQNSFLNEYREVFKSYKEAVNRLNQYQEEAKSFSKEYDFVKFQFDELDGINLSEEYWKNTEEEIDILTHAESILQNTGQAIQMLSENELNAEDILSEVQRLLAPIASLNSNLGKAYEEIENIQLYLRELVRELKNIQSDTDINEERLNEITAYHSAVNRLMQKHQMKSMSELIALHTQLKEQLERFNFSEEHIKALEKEVARLQAILLESGKKMSELRMAQAQSLGQAVTNTVTELGMPYAKVQFKVSSSDQPGKDGLDKIILLFAPNKGSEYKPLHQVGSGGEKSRLMLSVKSQIAKETALPTLIFDEIDTGISGEVALKTGDLLKSISRNHQVITITHLPQVAAAGNLHFLVYKSHLKDKSVTEIKPLREEDIVIEIAKMLSGENPSSAAIENARNLIGD